MSYNDQLIIDTDKDEAQTNDDTIVDFTEEEQLSSKQQKVNTRRRIEDILAEKEYKKTYGDIFDEF